MMHELKHKNLLEKIDFLHTEAVTKHKEGNLEEAIFFYLESIKLDKNQPAWIYGNVITLLAEVERFDEGLKLGEEAEKIHPESDEVYRAIGIIYQKQNNLNQALSYFQKAIELNQYQAEWLYTKISEYKSQLRSTQAQSVDCNSDNSLLKLNISSSVKSAIDDQDNAKKINYLHTEAVAKHKEGKLEKAISFYLKSIEIDENQPAWIYGNVITLLAEVGRLDEGLELREKAEKLHPESDEVYRAIAILFNKKGDIIGCVNNYQKAIQCNPQQPSWAYSQVVENLIRQNNIDRAIEIGEQGIELNPDCLWLYYHLGEALAAKEQWDKVVEIYRHAQELQPDLPEIEQKLNYALEKKVHIERVKSLESYLQKIEQDPTDVDSYWKAIEIQPDNVELYLKLTSILLEQERIDEALKCYQKAITVNPGLVDLYSSTGETLKHKPNCQESAKSTLSKISIESSINFSFYKLKETLWKQRKWDEIIALYHKNIRLKPNEPELYIGLANTLARQNRLNKAINLYEMALQLNPNHTEAEVRLKQITDKKHRLHKAFKNISTPTPGYALWLKENLPQSAKLDWMPELIDSLGYRPLISIIVPVYNTPESLLREMIQSVLDQIYPYWELCLADDASPNPHVRPILEEYAGTDERIKVVFREQNGHICAASNSALELATGEFITLLDHDDILTLDALYEIVLLLNRHPEADMIYSDEDKVNEEGQWLDPYFKPDWCPDSFLSRNYICHLGTYRRSIVNQIGGFRLGYEGSQDYDLVLRFTEKTNNIFHIPKILYHWRIHLASAASGSEAKPYAYDAGAKALQDALLRRGEPGKIIQNIQVPGVYIARYEIKDYPLVSIIIPTRNLGDILDRCLKSMFEKSTYPNYEVIIIDNGTDEPETMAIFDSWKDREPNRFRCHRLDIPFNYSRLNNFGVSYAKGDYLLFLNNDTEIITPDWIEAMVEQTQRESIGAVGAKLLYPDDTIQHAGVVIGIGGVAGHSHKHFSKDDQGYIRQLISVNNYSAVTAACLMCRRQVFEQVSGFDETLKVAFNDVDFCLKIQNQGYNNVYLPHVVLYHYESKSRGHEDTPEKQQRFRQEMDTIKQKWGDIISKDPCYSPNLTKTREDYCLNIQTKIEVVDVISAEQNHEKLWGFHIDTPQAGENILDILTICGWVLGNQSPASKVEVIYEGKIVQTTDVNQPRPDVAQIFSHVPQAENCGFGVMLDVIDLPTEAELLVKIVLEDGDSTSLGRVRLRY